MPLTAFDFVPQPGPLPIHRARVDGPRWQRLAEVMVARGGAFVDLWPGAGSHTVCVAYRLQTELYVAELPLEGDRTYAAVSSVFHAALRPQRRLRDLHGIEAVGAADRRPWLDHGAWNRGAGPTAFTSTLPQQRATGADYPFVVVDGEGVHEIAVGPVHAGIIEPGHFRFSVVGEKVLRLETRLGYVHRGVASRCLGQDTAGSAAIAARVSGDSTVAFSWAHAMAVEAAAGATVPPRATWLRAVLLERERVANHLGDLGALGNDAAFAFAATQFSALREQWQRGNAQAWGHRLLMEAVTAGGVASDPAPDVIAAMDAAVTTLGLQLRALRAIFDEHAGMQDRFVLTGRVEPALASRLGLTGLAARASGIALDLRQAGNWEPYATAGAPIVVQHNGDVAARVKQRFDELETSLQILGRLLTGMPAGATWVAVPPPRHGRGVGWVEGWRGPVLVALEFDGEGRVCAAHFHDPSTLNWPALEYAILGNIVADFPLINKSFNLSYAGHDL